MKLTKLNSMSGMPYLKHVLMLGKNEIGYNKHNQLTFLNALYDYFYY